MLLTVWAIGLQFTTCVPVAGRLGIRWYICAPRKSAAVHASSVATASGAPLTISRRSRSRGARSRRRNSASTAANAPAPTAEDLETALNEMANKPVDQEVIDWATDVLDGKVDEMREALEAAEPVAPVEPLP